jgi:hypothetical protein
MGLGRKHANLCYICGAMYMHSYVAYNILICAENLEMILETICSKSLRRHVENKVHGGENWS